MCVYGGGILSEKLKWSKCMKQPPGPSPQQEARMLGVFLGKHPAGQGSVHWWCPGSSQGSIPAPPELSGEEQEVGGTAGSLAQNLVTESSGHEPVGHQCPWLGFWDTQAPREVPSSTATWHTGLRWRASLLADSLRGFKVLEIHCAWCPCSQLVRSGPCGHHTV